MMKGYVQVYTGNGKGKTTAALGLALRAAGAGLRVFVAQFVKSGEYAEIKALRRFEDMIKIRQYGTGRFISGTPDDEDIRAARLGFDEVKKVIACGMYDVVILDEANIAAYYNLIAPGELVELILSRPEHVELIITGRHAHEKVLAHADLVTDMSEVKHYFAAGVPARDGIEK
jgi:cob(I)alamin adenosyltransferase